MTPLASDEVVTSSGLAAMREQVTAYHADGAITIAYWSIERQERLSSNDGWLSFKDRWVSVYESEIEALADADVTEREEDVVLTMTGEPLAVLRTIIAHTVIPVLKQEERA